MRIQVGDRELREALEYLSEDLVRPAARLALNDSGRQGNTAARKEIRARWNLKAGFINERVRISSFADEWDLSVVLQAKGRPIDLTHFGARWVRGNQVVSRAGVKVLKRSKGQGGVFYEAERGKKERIPSGFIATVAAGTKGATHMGVFVRAGKGRLPIIKKRVISVPSMFEQEPVFRAIVQVVEEKFPQRFEHHIDRAVARRFGSS
ncbi:phage tail protein [Desulfuromonas sp. TF]|uniref:phage tail protein n=1 Tax=Desulfuromonas sp. TF TaxID=1232410 RepID=UPI000487F409|nr:phage tail protein [Desulfuromonas sp. TF]